MSERSYCSELAIDEPMWGTAEEVDVWLLLEYNPTWNAKAVTDNNLDDSSKNWLEETIATVMAKDLKVRVQFIRQPELDRDTTCLMVAFDGRVWSYRGVGYEFLQQIDVTASLDEPAQADLITEPQYFVCTNGQRDLCCARFGLPAYERMRELVGTRVWQTSHLGGHRFAPNVLALPQGVLYGRVIPEEVDSFVTEVDGGGLSFAHLRGRSRYPQLVQAAEAIAAQPLLKLLHVDELQRTGDEISHASVTFASPNETVKVSVQMSVEPAEVLTSCSADELKPVYSFHKSHKDNSVPK
ncbi:MAG: hypothetical protein O7G86_10175 [Gammaproteobacteria bacterium]|nr:hypothetical protein [Gammaproteobacteria bacterium]